MKTKYLIRLDDACPYMDRKKWQRMEDILDKYGIKPLVGIIPSNADPKTMFEPEDPHFWTKEKKWEEKGWIIALHGYDHVYCSNEGGINSLWERSEFAGVPLDIQIDKIRKGYAVLRAHGIEPKVFFAPSHTFDMNTLEALRKETNIRIISDTIGRYPYRKDDFYFIPLLAGHFAKMPVSGIYTSCFHPNTMEDGDFRSLEFFLGAYKDHFIRFDDIDLSKYKSKKMVDRLLSWLFFTYRKIRV